MNRLIACLFVVSGLSLLVTPASAQLGVAAGLNFESMSDISGSSFSDTYDASTGYHVGLFLNLGAGPVAARIGAFYRDLGEFDVSLSGFRRSVSLSSLDFPIDLRFNVLPTPVVSPYILAGPVLSVPRSEDEDYDEALEDFSVSGNVGFGLSISAGGLKLLPEFRYAVGVTRFVRDEFTLAGQTFVASEDEQRSNTAQLRLGILF